MKKILSALIIGVMFTLYASAQVGIGTTSPASSAMLDVTSSDKGLLIPRLNSDQRNSMGGLLDGLMVYDVDWDDIFLVRKGTWIQVLSSGSGWSLDGNSGISNWKFLGTTDNQSLKFKVNNSTAGILDPVLQNTGFGYRTLSQPPTGAMNTAVGTFALSFVTTGYSNVAIGAFALYNNLIKSNLVAIGDSALYYNSLGATETIHSTRNTAVGSKALYENTTGYSNTAVGFNAMRYATTGNLNVAVGSNALNGYNTGNYNIAIGAGTLSSNSSGWGNVAVGHQALYLNNTGSENTAIGYGAMECYYGSGNWNIAVGSNSLSDNVTGWSNCAIGVSAMKMNQDGYRNTALGEAALYDLREGNVNTAIGPSALYWNRVDGNLAIGAYTMLYNTWASRNIAIGNNALGAQAYANGNVSYNTYNVAIGYDALATNNPTSTSDGYHNNAVGYRSLYANTTGTGNSAVGNHTLYQNSTGNHNTALGRYALYTNSTGNYNTAVGYQAGYYRSNVSTGTFIGHNTYCTVDDVGNVSGLGYNAHPYQANQVVIGNASVTSNGGYAAWTDFSDGRYKTGVTENVAGLAFIMKLRPVTYHLDVNRLASDLGEDIQPDENGNPVPRTPSAAEIQSRNDKSAILYTGFIAQEVESAARSIGYDFSGVDAPRSSSGFYGLRYAEFVVPLVKAVQEQQQVISELGSQILELREINQALMKRIEILEGK